MTQLTTTIALLAALAAGLAWVPGRGNSATEESKGINPVQHSERNAPAGTTNNSKGINPVQHSE